MSNFLITLLMVGALAAYLVAVYNRLVSLRNRHGSASPENPSSINALAQADIKLGGALGSFSLMMEDYFRPKSRRMYGRYVNAYINLYINPAKLKS